MKIHNGFVYFLISVIIVGLFAAGTFRITTRIDTIDQSLSADVIAPSLARSQSSYIPADDQLYAINQTIEAFDYWYLPIPWEAEYVASGDYYVNGDGVVGSFTVSGGNIEFFIIDSGQFTTWELGGYVVVWHHQASTSSYNWEFQSSRPGTWYFMFNNDHSSSVQVSGQIIKDKTPPTISTNLQQDGNYSSTTQISISATDELFSVSYVGLAIDGIDVEVEFSSQLSYVWDTTEYNDGQHTIIVFAGDNVGNYDEQTLTVSVYNPPVLPFVPPDFLVLMLAFVVIVSIVYVVNRRPKVRAVKGIEHDSASQEYSQIYDPLFIRCTSCGRLYDRTQIMLVAGRPICKICVMNLLGR